jgi:hypothetical protein
VVAPKPVDEARLRELVEAGLPDGEVGRRLDPPVSASVVRRHRLRLGLDKTLGPAPGPRATWTAEILVRCSPEEREELDRRAAEEGYPTRHDYVRALLFPSSLASSSAQVTGSLV